MKRRSSAAPEEVRPPPAVADEGQGRHDFDFMKRRLEFKLQQLDDTVEEYFDAVGAPRTLQDRRRNEHGPTAASLVAFTQQLPIVPAREEERKDGAPVGGPAAQTRGDRMEAVIAAATGVSAVGRGMQTGGPQMRSDTMVRAKRLDDELLLQSKIMCSLSMASVVAMLIASSIGWRAKERVAGSLLTCAKATNGLQPELSSATELAIWILMAAILVFSALCIAAIVRYYYTIYRAKQVEWCRLNGVEVIPRSEAYHFLRSPYPRWMAFEIALHLLFPYPMFNQLTNNGGNSKYLELFMLVRAYSILRVLHQQSPLYRSRHDIVANTPDLQRANYKVTFTDTMKVYCYQHTIVAGLVMYAFVAIIGGFAVFVAERDSNNGCFPVPAAPGLPGLGFNSIFDGVYFMVVSVRTIGFGDLKPITIVGRLMTIVFTFAGIAVEAFVASVVINKVAQTQEEKTVDEYLKTYRGWHDLRVASALLIQAAYKMSVMYRANRRLLSRREKEEWRTRLRTRETLLSRMRLTKSLFPTPVYSDGTAQPPQANGTLASQAELFRRVEREPVLVRMGLPAMLAVSADDKGDVQHGEALRRQETSHEDQLFRRIPYLRPRLEELDSVALLRKQQALFTQDIDVRRWIRTSNVPPEGVKLTHKFAGTKKVVYKEGKGFKEFRTPLKAGHKADLLIDAQKRFRAARLSFKQSTATSADHVVDSKLVMAYELIASASRKVTRNARMLGALRSTVDLELSGVEKLVAVALSGGADGPTAAAAAGGRQTKVTFA